MMDETVDTSPVSEKTGENDMLINGVEREMEENYNEHEGEENPEESHAEHEENHVDQDENNGVESDPEGEDMEEMEITTDLPDIEVEACRLCDDVSEKMFNIFEDNPEGYQLIGLIKENLPIVLYKTDPLSKQVCEKCVLNLQIISSLKKRSRQTQEKYVDKLKSECDTNDKNVLLFLGCTGSKLVDNGDDEEEEEEELKDQATSTEDLTILCANCKTSILDASTVNGELELSSNLHEIIKDSLRRNRVITVDDLSPSEGGPSDIESEDSEERPAKRRKIDESSREIQDEINRALAKKNDMNGVTDEDSLDKEDESSEKNDSEEESKREEYERAKKEQEEQLKREKEEQETKDKEEMERIEQIKVICEEIFKEEPDFTFEPLTLLEAALNTINAQNVPDFQPQHFKTQSTVCFCKMCGEEFKNAKLLALHEPTHMDVDMEEKIDNPQQWPKNHQFAKIRNKWLTRFDETFDEYDDIDVEDKEDELLVEDTEKTMAMSKKDEVVLVDMKPMVNGVYLGDYTKEERKAFYQCMRIGGQTKRFCPLCRYCFKDNWAIESHYFSFACYYTCRHCGMRFNKQRHRFDDHTKEHKKKKDPISDKIYTASKVNNTLPKVIQPDKVKKVVPGDPEKPREIRLEDYMSPPIITKGGFDQRGTRYSNSPGQFPPNYQTVKVKEEPKDPNNTSVNNKSQNQAYFCRKCYKVFFKLDEFNAHSRNCDYSSFAPMQRTNSPNSLPKMGPIKVKQEQGVERGMNGSVSTGGRPVRNCAKDIGPYKDEVYIPKQILNDTIPGPPQSFICHICGTPFPTIYSRNSHMRIHKGEQAGASPSNNGHSPQMMAQQNILRQRLQQQQQNQQNYTAQRVQGQGISQQQRQMLIQRKIQQQRALQQQRQQQQEQQNNYQQQFEEIRVKEEPVDSFEPMVEIHEGHESSPSPPPPQTQVPRNIGGGAVSLTPIVKKPALNPNIQKLIANNPNISLAPSRKSTPPAQRNGERNLIKNQGGYQGPYAPSTQNQGQSREMNVTPQMRYITVSPNLMPSDDNKSYKCSSCWEAFSNKSHLYFHKKNQCEGSRFPCPFCKKRFGTEAAYSSHIFYSHPE
ncbi:uncharacterized protein LOC126739235 isoform X2 [Anthonomus grandis grandis]|uniref:uncharacterized protein LOC126739235 isoform X2 n=1 Tax=Anthonomus grandis grandis TaxID=2921223 RepID=UPI0021651784|nr:uncharacterized protein LOC126739235 isoform X2 [Anthonomus grandis grandis]